MMETNESMSTRNMLPDPGHDLRFDKPILRWDEAIPLGNGMMGCLIWGDGSPLRISLDRADLWDTRIAPEWLSNENTYKELIELVESGDQDEIVRRFDVPYLRPTPTKIPAGRLELDFGRPCSSVFSRLSLADATAEIKLVFDDGAFATVKAFHHSVEQFGFITLSGTATPLGVNVVAHEFSRSGYSDSGSNDETVAIPEAECEGTSWFLETERKLSLLDYPPASFGQDGCITWFRQSTCEDLEFAVIMASRKSDCGTLDVAYVVASSQDGSDWFEDAKRMVVSAVESGFDIAYQYHASWWEKFWSKSAISLPDNEAERCWYIANYFFGSCSRMGVPPISLQGVWTADDGCLPPWKSDYHHDLNVQMNYWHYMKANHLEEGKTLTDFLWDLTDKARHFARSFFDAPGLCLPAVMSIDGKPLGGYPMYSLSMTNHAWLCQAFDHYWRYTDDIDFLREKAYPYMKETAECILRWLSPGKDGKLRLRLSSSPETHDNSLKAWLTPNSNFDISIMRYMFGTLAVMAETLENGEVNRWQVLLDSCPELSINRSGVLMLSPDESLAESHRHLSHAMAIYPLALLEYHGSERQREIIDATIANLELLGTGGWIGFSYTWMAALYAIQGNGEGAAYQLKLFRECFCSPNGFHLNGDYKRRGLCALHERPFTLEANMSYADSLQEMLLQTRCGVIRVLPAIPDDWKERGVSFQYLRGEKGVLVSAQMKQGRLQHIRLNADQDGVFAIENAFDTDVISVDKGDSVTAKLCDLGGIFTVELLKNKTCFITAHADMNLI